MNDGWEGILDPGETILWQGRPDGAVVFRPSHIVTFIFGLFFAGFALFWMIMASRAGGFFWMFGLLHFAVGLGISFGPFLWSAYRRRHSWYTLTDRRAIIATDLILRGKSLASFPITVDTALHFIDDIPATIHFAETTHRTKNGTRTIPIGFERITPGRDIYRLMRDIQQKDGHKQAEQ